MNKFNLENCRNVKLDLNSFSLLRLINSESSKYVADEYKLQWFSCINLDEYMINENLACKSRGTKMSEVWHSTQDV